MMGCYKVRCKKCGKIIKGENQFKLILNQSEHEKNKHPDIINKNKLAKEKFNKKMKKINDELIFSEEYIFTQSKWDGEDYE